jgi:uncharacterized protein YbaR (Trm112 family)
MYSGLPAGQIDLLQCPHDRGALTISERRDGSSHDCIVNGTLRCEWCGRRYHIEDGILRLLDRDALDKESAHERRLRDEGAELEYELSIADPVDNEREVSPTLELLHPTREGVLIELGCGAGRYTIPMAAQCGALLAVDFSLDALRILARRLSPEMPVALVNADITHLKVAPRRFDGCLSTLVSNLPSRRHRDAMFAVVSEALKDDGRFVFSTHFLGLRERLSGTPQAGRYREGGIYRYYFRKREIAGEATQFFANVQTRPIKVTLPFLGRLGIPSARLSQISERAPLLNQLGRLLLVSATEPVRPRSPEDARGFATAANW